MKIAIITDDGKTVSKHFGRAQYYLVVEVLEGKEIGRDLREKAGHHNFSKAEKIQNQPSGEHGLDAAAQSRHTAMLKSILDCEVVIAGGMGRGAEQNLIESGKQVIMIHQEDVEEVIEDFLKGDLKNAEDLIH